MKKTVCKKEYDTETMTVVKKAAHGAYGDPAGYEEVLYVAADGKYFLYGVGGETSPYPQEKLVSLAKLKTLTPLPPPPLGRAGGLKKPPPPLLALCSGLRKNLSGKFTEKG